MIAGRLRSSATARNPAPLRRGASGRASAARPWLPGHEGERSASPLLQQATVEEEPAQQQQQQLQQQQQQQQRQSWRVRALSAVNESTKWTVSAAVFAVLVWQHNEFAAWCVLGAVASSFVCKVLKHAINQQRPESAQKSDPGMPSSHANSLCFLSTYAALSLVHHTRSQPVAVGLAAATVALGAFLTWLRVGLGYHTWPQVLVGAGLGASTSAAWFLLGTSWALPALQHAPAGLPGLYLLTAAGMAGFAVKNVLAWARERRERASAERRRAAELEQLRRKLAQGGPAAPEPLEPQAPPPVAVPAAALAN